MNGWQPNGARGGVQAALAGALMALPPVAAAQDGAAPGLWIAWSVWAAALVALTAIAAALGAFYLRLRRADQALEAAEAALERERRINAFGGLVAASAHEFGTPMSTIKLTARELAAALVDQPELHRDAALIELEVERCNALLRRIRSQAERGGDGAMTPLTALVREAAAPHADRGVAIIEDIIGAAADEPRLPHSPEIVLGLRNLIQNAVDFALARVWLDLDWSGEGVSVTIRDDGPGLPAALLGRPTGALERIARAEGVDRPGYAGMRLGLVIATTLLERTGAVIDFANARSLRDADRPAAGLSSPATGAVIRVRWPRAAPGRDAAETPG